MRESFCALVPHADHRRVLLMSSGGGWALPEFVEAQDTNAPSPRLLRALLQDRLGLDTVLLGSMRLFEAALPGAMTVFITERAPADWRPPPEAAWVGSRELPTTAMALPRQRAVLGAWLAEAQGESVPSLRLPWWGEGWASRAWGWISAEASRIGVSVSAPLEQVKSGYTASVLRVTTSGGPLFFKAVSPPLAGELILTRALAGADPMHLPRILASDEREGWMLLADIGGRPLGEVADLRAWGDILRVYARRQTQSVDRLERWERLPLPDMRLAAISASLEDAFRQLPARLGGLPDTLTEAELNALTDRIPELRGLCGELASFGLPAALAHGDLHAGNIRVTASGPVFFDWSHSCLTHPFFDLGDLLADDDWFPGRADASDCLRDAYLEEWAVYATPARLRAAFTLSQRLYRLYVVVGRIRRLAQFQGLLVGGLGYVAETPTGGVLQDLQWWLATDVRKLLSVAE